MAEPTSVRPVRVLFSLSRIRPTTNPYLVQLIESLPEDVEMVFFSWRRALLGRYDVVHVHWPEVVFRKTTRLRSLAARLAYGAFLLRLAVTRTPLVRTIHNITPYEEASRHEQLLIDGTDRLTKFWVCLNDHTPVPDGGRSRTIPIGLPPAVFTAHEGPAAEPGRILHFGLVRPYKGIEELISAFAGVDDPALRLAIAGRCDDPAYREVVQAQSARDPRISVDLRHLSDEELADEVCRAQLVVLPYRTMHNSSAAILALSMGRPVLVPELQVTASLAAEVGPGWVQRYDGMLRPEHVRAALGAASTLDVSTRPAMADRTWPHIGNAHAEVYHAVVGRGRRARVEEHRRASSLPDGVQELGR